MDKRRKTSVAISVDQEMLDRWKAASFELGYTNFSQFVRDCIEEKLAGLRVSCEEPAPQDNDDDLNGNFI